MESVHAQEKNKAIRLSSVSKRIDSFGEGVQMSTREKASMDWQKLTKDQIKMLGFTTYDGEVILINASVSYVTSDSFYFNAQEFFDESELSKMPYFGASPFKMSNLSYYLNSELPRQINKT